MDHFATTGFTRRALIAGGIAGGVAALAPAEGAFFDAGGRALGVQLYPLSDDVRRDLPGTFAHLARLGCRSVETSGFHGYTGEELKAAADAAELRIASVHAQPQLRLSRTDHLLTDDPAPLIAELRAMDVTTVVMPLMLLPEAVLPDLTRDVESVLARTVNAFGVADWRRTVAFLNERGSVLKRAGVQLAYHNHNLEFAPIAGAGNTTGWDLLLAETDPALVTIEMDVGWVVAAGRDPVDLLRRHRGRISMLHMKDVDRATRPNFALHQTSAPAGKGIVAWPRLLAAAARGGVSGYFVEQEPPFRTTPMNEIAQSIAYLRTVP